MLKHYLKIAFRNMQKQKMYAAINDNYLLAGNQSRNGKPGEELRTE
jgi:hypothetical protein